MRRFIIEFGLGMDFHGQDVGKAAVKAVRDATTKSCLCGLKEVLELDDLDRSVLIKVTVAVSRPEAVVAGDIEKCLPVGRVEVNAVKGGLNVPGLLMPQFGDKDDSIEVAIACVEVWIVD
ncbi:MAG: Lin0512 family protein [Synergistaceae bacterium]|jgi:uncharacterized protein (TIGR02058 family)|nr:Lin0512 family protein [Synergistaceae bacterium]